MSIRAIVIQTPVLGRLYLMATRLVTALRYYKKPLSELIHWLITSKETTNFTYDLDDLNKKYLASFISQVTRKDRQEILGYLQEIETDEPLRQHIHQATIRSERRHTADHIARFGRRIGWYAMVRAIKPHVVVETGVDKGLGSCAITAALKKNTEQGHPGFYYGVDIHPRAGFLLCGVYATFGHIIHSDSIKALEKIPAPIDLLISDSDHSYAYERREYDVVNAKLSPEGMIISDNAHATDALLKFAENTGRKFSFFQEKPVNHWYPGAGIGVVYHEVTLITEMSMNPSQLKTTSPIEQPATHSSWI